VQIKSFCPPTKVLEFSICFGAESGFGVCWKAGKF
jgi:hypothetical protein